MKALILFVILFSIIGITDSAFSISQYPIYDVTDYGAVPDDGVDDSNQIQAALTDAAGGKGGELFFPPGEYKIETSSLSATLQENATLHIRSVGAWLNASALSEPSSETGVINIDGASTASIIIEDISIISGSTSVLGNLDGIKLTGPFKNVYLKNVRVELCSNWGINIYYANAGLIENCSAINNRRGGLFLHRCSNLSVIGGYMSENGTPGAGASYGITLDSSYSPGEYCQNILITGVTANGNLRKGIDVHNGHKIKIIGNTVIGFGTSTELTPSGIYALGEHSGKDVQDIVIADNVIDATGANPAIPVYGIQAGTWGDYSPPDGGTLIIQGNTIRNCNNNSNSRSIMVDTPVNGSTVSKVIIANNTFYYGSGSSVEVIRCGDIWGPAGGPHIPDVLVTGNQLHTSSCRAVISLMQVTRSVVTNNTIIVDSGSCIDIESDGAALSDNNVLAGAATAATGSKRFTLQTGGSTAAIDLVTANIGASSAAILIYIKIYESRYDNSGMAIFDGYAWAYNVGSSFGQSVRLNKAVLGFVNLPSLTWSGSGTTRTLQITGNNTYSSLNIEVSVVTTYGRFLFK